ncbi:tryptophan--tRNA ligase [Sphingomonas swuensis]|uniref:Tryptophan--tRNA ligase n=1 Tax=Sphingomonas swuensis TaxID=977800 RepID=A0ABP7T4G3_9SPHN
MPDAPAAAIPVTRVVSGIQPTGNLHLGNLLGAILRWVKMQDEAPCLFFLADLHSLSDHIPAETRLAQVRSMAAALVASGIDPQKAILFAQSDVPAHAELCWLLNGTARMGWLHRMTQWKDKSGKNKEGASVALFDYPVLQAADILLYQASHVPVGEDQKQHIELTRDIAIKFNQDTGTDLFTVPQPFIGGGTAARVMSLRDGSAKMSKSDPSDMSRINLVDSDEEIAAKIRKARTDPEPLPGDPELLKERPEARNLVGIMAAVTNESEAAVLARFEGQGFGAFKPALADALVAMIAPIRARFNELERDVAALDRILDDGAARANALGQPTLLAAKRALGLSRH